jgi:hypothetical protein
MRDVLTVDHQDHLLPSLGQLRLLRFLFKIRKKACLRCLTPPLLQNMVVRLYHCIDSTSNRTATFCVRMNVA